ncbi:MAG: FAD-dependent oxidoreductase [Chloroflexi bacterium]|nr:FAD-dependent oxidoreductase [Chloroflexota bacterium]
MIEIKFVGTGGQGSVVASKLLAHAAVDGGYESQAFASYGYPRRAGMVAGYVRISKEKILLHSEIYEPDYIVLMSDTFASDPRNIAGLKAGGAVIINSAKPPESFSALGNVRILTVNADAIAAEAGVILPSGVPIINTTVLGALEGVMSVVGIDNLAESIRTGGIPAPEKNVKAARKAYLTVRAQVTSATAPELGEEIMVRVVKEHLPEYRERISPCEANCPAGHPIRRTVSLIQSGRFEEALANIRSEHPFPGTCGRVCFHPCEENCNRGEYDEEVAINALERAAFDYAGTSPTAKPAKKSGKSIAIIGSGPAGMACAYFSALLGHEVTVFEALPVAGGIPRVGIPEYRLPKDTINQEVARIVDLGINLRTNTEVGKDISFDAIKRGFDACFIATGAHKSSKLNIPGEETTGAISGLELLKGTSLGKKVKMGKKVAVIGGGNVAIDAARTAKRLGAEEVQLVCLESRRTMPAFGPEVEEAVREGIGLICQVMPVRIHGNGKQVTGLECTKVKGGKRNKIGWLTWPQSIEGSNFIIDADSVIVAIGATSDIPFLPAEIAKEGRLIKVDYFGRTSMPGIFAGGDATIPAGSVVEAIGSGKRAALGIDLFLKGAGEATFASLQRENNQSVSMVEYQSGDFTNDGNSPVSFPELNTAYFVKSPRLKLPQVPRSARASNFDEVNLGLSEESAIASAERCFQCGRCNLCETCFIVCPDFAVRLDDNGSAFMVNPDLCKKCGICAEECPRSVIAW